MADRPAPPPGRVVAIVRGHAPAATVQIAAGLEEAGITTIEVTLDSPDALESIAALRVRPRLVVGAGTVLSLADADAALAAGATFLVSPHTDPELIRHGAERGVATLPGALTPTEILTAWEAGAAAVKVFPAGPFGPAYLASLRGPLGHIPLVPTGGIGEDNAAAFVAAGAIALGVGGWLTATADHAVVADRARRLLQALASP
jgi:2-dehydro-3-deoxyphosphogluconate aldolase/(4S)-4-hydroxy-2-oxoglutarate aldolase